MISSSEVSKLGISHAHAELYSGFTSLTTSSRAERLQPALIRKSEGMNQSINQSIKNLPACLTVFRVGQQEDVGMLRVVGHHRHETHHTHTLAGCRLELCGGEREKEKGGVRGETVTHLSRTTLLCVCRRRYYMKKCIPPCVCLRVAVISCLCGHKVLITL